MVAERVQAAAQEALRHFKRFERKKDDVIWVLKDKVPGWVEALVFRAHGDMGADDWRYEFIVESLNAIAEAEVPVDVWLEADIHTHELLLWLSSRADRYGFVDDAVEAMGGWADFGRMKENASVITAIAMGQEKEKNEVYQAVLGMLEELGSKRWFPGT